MRPCEIPRRIGTKAAPTLALCAGLWIALWPGAANATVDSISPLRDMEFGSVAGDADLAGTATIPTDANTKSVAGGAFDFGGNVVRGRFRLNGPANSSYDCTLPSSRTLTSGGNTIVVDNIVSTKSMSGNLNNNGRKNHRIGGTLQVAAGQAAGNYTATMTMDCGTVAATVDVTATLLAPISISASGDMDFGTMLTTGIPGGTVTVTPAGAISSVNVDLFGGFPAAASFDVTGASGQAYVITLPPDGTVTLTGPGAPMAVDAFTDDAGATPTLVGGSDTFNVGATLKVGATQAAGNYSGTFSVTANYN